MDEHGFRLRLRVRATLAGFDAAAEEAMRAVLADERQPAPGRPFCLLVDREWLSVSIGPDWEEFGQTGILGESDLPLGLCDEEVTEEFWAALAPGYDPHQVMEEELYPWLAARWAAACDGRPQPAIAGDSPLGPMAFDLLRNDWYVYEPDTGRLWPAEPDSTAPGRDPAD